MSSRPDSEPVRLYANYWSDPRLRVPSIEAWTAMTEAEKVQLEQRINGLLAAYRARDREEWVREQEEAVQKTTREMERACAGLRTLLLQQIAARELAITEAQREDVRACEDVERLVRWLAGVGAAASVEALLSE